MKNRELKDLIQKTAEDQGVHGVMALTKIVKEEKGLNYERVSKVWSGSLTTKFSDIIAVADVLGMKVEITDKVKI